jgi:mono/diheme cytochrome c family protein
MARLAVGLMIGVVALMLPAGAAAQDANPNALPEGGGKALVATRCVGCHDLNTAVSRRGTAAEWRETITRMVERGAQIPAAESATIASYLAEHFGPAAAPAADTVAALPAGPGRDLLTGKCFQCHGQTMWNDLRQDRRAWLGVLYRMVGRRALWTEDEINGMADYLARARGPSTPAR